MKLKHVTLTVLVVILLDQLLKIYIKTHFFYGEELNVAGDWFKLHFIENEGMAFGMKFGERWGKLFLTLFFDNPIKIRTRVPSVRAFLMAALVK